MLVCHLAGISDQAILDGLNKVQVKGRVEMLPVSKDYYLIIDYAHNEVSTRSVLTTLMEYHPKRLICVYGGGGNRSKLRRYDMGEVTGEMADHYDIYYRVHAQSFGWLDWAKNGAPSGTAGYAKRLEGIQIILVPKGQPAPAKNYGGITSVRASYIAK